MLDKEQIYRRLKQANISRDKAKTRERLKNVWAQLATELRKTVFEISDLQKSTLERSCREGNISVRLALALGDAAHIDPYFLAAMTDVPSSNVDEDLLLNFLKDMGYTAMVSGHLTRDIKPFDGTKADEQALPSTLPATIAEISQKEISALPEDTIQLLDSMSVEDMQYLIKAIELRSCFNRDAKLLLRLVKIILTIG
jgi:hypothetical protein